MMKTRLMCLLFTAACSSQLLAQPRPGLQFPNSPTEPTAPVIQADPATEMHREPIPVYMGVQQHRDRSLAANMLDGRTIRGSNPFVWQNTNTRRTGNWVVTPLGNAMARIDWCMNDRFWGLQAFATDQPLRCVAVASTVDQLWRMQTYPGAPGTFLLESLMYPGYCATLFDNSIFLQPINFLPTQQWWFDRPSTLALPPVLRNTSQQVIPNQPLPPAQVTLVNQSRDNVIALVAELRNPSAAQEIQIPGGASKVIELQRDSGATVVETFELSSSGVWDQQQRTYQIPPVPLYDISIYEVFLQSIAIDRTGTSPNPIEDINYQPRSIGIFPIPAGAELPEVATIDVMQTAERSKNPGGVRPLPSKLKPVVGGANQADPLKAILDEIQSRRKSF
jgi:hypothetical protein